MGTYCAKFIPSFSDVSHPLRNLTKKDVPFQWSLEHQSSFEKIKEVLTSETVRHTFTHPKRQLMPLQLVYQQSYISDNTRKARSENCRVCEYRSLSDVETEKEALAIVWAVERLHLYLYGKRFNLHIDCKPVQLIFGNPKSKPPARIERWNLRLYKATNSM